MNDTIVYRSADGYVATVVNAGGAERVVAETEVDAGAFPLPLFHRRAWAVAHPFLTTRFVVIRDARGGCRGGFGFQLTRSRALPGHKILRVERFGASMAPDAADAAVGMVAHAARTVPLLLRAHLEVFAKDAGIRDRIGELARVHGFVANDTPRLYSETLVLDLGPEEVQLMAAFRKGTRRNIAEPMRRSMTVKPIQDDVHAPRMNDLIETSMARTGGRAVPGDWSRRIALSVQHPSLSRIVGVFMPSVTPPQDLVAFAWGRAHGDHVEYAEAGSLRIANASLTHALAWDLICWARRSGATWFDFGGVTSGHAGSADPLGGISDFKRSFGGVQVRVGQEWVLEPNAVSARIARLIGTTTAKVARLVGRGGVGPR